MRKSLLSILVTAFVWPLLGQTSTAQTRIPTPPGSATFEFNPPDEVAFARLWLDVGQFHPFSGQVSRKDWERGFFGLMNKIAAGQMPLREAAAQAIGNLQDPGSMVLGPEEGSGPFILPLLFEARKDGVWIIGGSKAVAPAPFGPLARVDQSPLDAFLAARVGHQPTSLQALAVLRTATQSWKTKTWLFEDTKGKVLKADSVNTLPDDLWIEGGWKGRPIHDLGKTGAPGSKADAGLDLRSLDWVREGTALAGRTIDALGALSKVVAHRGPLYEIKQVRRGYLDGESTYDPYQATTIAQLITIPPDPSGEPSKLAVTTGTSPLPEGDLAQALAGWALPTPIDAPAALTVYGLNDQVVVRLRTSSLTSNAPLGNQSFYPGALNFIGFNQTPEWSILTVPAAKDLAAAAILHWVQHWGFIQPERQALAFKSISELPGKVTSVHDLILRASFYLDDPHTTAATLDHRDLGSGEWDDGKGSKKSRLPFVGYALPDGSLRVLRPAEGSPLNPGAIVTAIEGRPTKDWLAEIQVRNPTPDNSFRAVKDLGMLFPYDKPLTLTFRNPGESSRSEVVSNCLYTGPWKAEDPSVVKALADKGWVYVGKVQEIKEAQIIDGLMAGKNYLLDFRFLNLANWAGRSKGMKQVHLEDWVRNVSSPIRWGQPDQSSSVLTCFFERLGHLEQPSPQPFKGRVVVLVCGNTQSAMESGALLWQGSLPGTCMVAGTPTSGVTGPISLLKLPLGATERYEFFSGTANFAIINGHAVHPGGVPLDLTFSMEDLERAAAAGSSDPFITLLMDRLK